MRLTRMMAAATAGASALAVAACATPAAESSPTPSPSPTESAPAAVERAAAWVVDLGSETWATPAVDGDLIYVGANDGVVRGIDARAGTLVWELATEGDVRGEVLVGEALNYVTSDDGLVYAFDDAGTVAWTARMGEAAGPRDDYSTYGSRPALADGVVFAAGQQGVMVALDEASGERLWSVELDGAVETNIAVADGLVHVGTMGDTHYTLDAATGDVVWELPMGGEVTTHPAVVDGVLLIGARSARLLARDPVTGEKLWTDGFGSSWVQSGATLLGDGTVVVGSSDLSQVRAYAVADGTRPWTAEVLGWPWGQPAVADGVVYATEVRLDYQQPWDAALSAFDAETGALLWWANTGASLDWFPGGYSSHGAGAGPAVAGDYVVVAGLDGAVYAFSR